VSADYDKIAGFFEDLDLYLSRLKILEKWVPPVPELKVALAQVLTSVLVLCGICAKYVLMKRFGNCTFSSAPFLESFLENCLAHIFRTQSYDVLSQVLYNATYAKESA